MAECDHNWTGVYENGEKIGYICTKCSARKGL